jgi:uncharacterized protein with NRDE domain
MCTLIVLHRCVAGKPLVVAANRDEFFARPAEGPAIRSARSGRILAPRDLEAGGSWVGLSERGVFAGLTNLRPTAVAPTRRALGEAGGETEARGGRGEPGASPLRSRGEVVMAALEARSAEEAAETLSRLEEGLYNPFQLFVGDARTAALLVYRDRPRIFALEPGLHVVGNVDDERAAGAFGEQLAPTCAVGRDESRSEIRGESRDGNGAESAFPGFEGIEGLNDTEEPRVQKLARIRGRVEKLLTEPGRDLFEGLARICREHVERGDHEELGAQPRPTSPFESTCVHVADRYGTRSSLLLELSEDVNASRLWTTDGPPCRRPFENRSSLLRELGVRLGS